MAAENLGRRYGWQPKTMAAKNLGRQKPWPPKTMAAENDEPQP
jgi:hypothetical protein